MLASALINPFPYFNDKSGLPLTGASIYIGGANQDPQTHPIAVYSDAALTIPFPGGQPLRTIGGYVAASGSPANAFPATTPYSIRLRNALGVEVFYQPAVHDEIADFLNSLSGAAGAEILGFQQAGSGTVVTTAAAKMQQQWDIADFATPEQIEAMLSNYSTDDTPILNAVNANTSCKYIRLMAGSTMRVSGWTPKAGLTIDWNGAKFQSVLGSTSDMIVANNVADLTFIRPWLDYTGGSGTGSNLHLTACANFRADVIRSDNAKNHAVFLADCPDVDIGTIKGIAATDWAVRIEGAGTIGGNIGLIDFQNCQQRIAMVRTLVSGLTIGTVKGKGNKGTAMWFQNVDRCHCELVDDDNDLLGDSAAIESSRDTSIGTVSAYQCGGHGGSIAANASLGPCLRCSINKVISSYQGESFATITDEGTGVTQVACTIGETIGNVCSRGDDGGTTPVPSDGVSISRAQQCFMYRVNIYNAGTHMLRAATVIEGNNSRIEVDSWDAGTGYMGGNKYAAVDNASNAILHTGLGLSSGRQESVPISPGDTSYTFLPGIHPHAINLFNVAPIPAGGFDIIFSEGWTNLAASVAVPVFGGPVRCRVGSITGTAIYTFDGNTLGVVSFFLDASGNWNVNQRAVQRYT